MQELFRVWRRLLEKFVPQYEYSFKTKNMMPLSYQLKSIILHALSSLSAIGYVKKGFKRIF